MSGVQENACSIGQLGHRRLKVTEPLETVSVPVAQIEDDIGDVFQERIDALDEVGERFGCAVASARIQGLHSEGPAKVDVPFELAQVVREIALVGVCLAAREVAYVEAG